jgi:hypothetical protein
MNAAVVLPAISANPLTVMVGPASSVEMGVHSHWRPRDTYQPSITCFFLTFQ